MRRALPPVEQDKNNNIIVSWDIRPHWTVGLTDEEREQLRDAARLFREQALKRNES